MHLGNTITSVLSSTAAACIALCVTSAAYAQSNDLFAPGNIVVSRSTYTGTASTVPFPGSLPNNAASTADGTFPNVFNNETPDGSFGVTSPVFIDQLDPTTGNLIGSPTNVTSLISSQLGANVTTSFPSKSELGLHFTPDGTGITFTAYGAAQNSLDISNSNTPGHVDITDPVNGQGVLIAQRDIVELSYNGTVQVTKTNAYSGNNGRNVVLGSNGNYYLVGNAGNNGSSMTLGISFAAGTVAISNGSNSVTLSGSANTNNLIVGMPFSGTNIPAGTTITTIDSSSQFHLSANATGSASGAYVACTVTTSNGSNSVTLSSTSSTANIYVGTPFSGTNIPVGSYVTSIVSPTQFTISTAATGTASGSYVANAGAYQLTGVSFASGNTNITVADTSKLVPGMPLSGTGLATGSYIASITDATHFVASASPTANSSGTASYTASVSNSMLSDNTGVRSIQKGQNDTAGTGTGILDAINNSFVVGKVNGTYGTTPGYQRGFTVTQLGVVLSGDTTSGSPTVSNLSPPVATETANNIQLYAGLPVTGPGIPSSTTISSIDNANNTVTLNKNATATASAVSLTFAPAADKSGKDDNFRGITNYKNTIYISKGSGGNGFDAVYQVNPSGGAYVSPGSSAGLATAANAASASINPLPGWPTGSTGANEGKSNGTTVHHPFGMWFANDTTLYVADEGVTGNSGSNAAVGGLEKWIYNATTGNWEYKYTLAASTIPQYTVSGSVGGVAGSVGPLQAEGLRNIDGVNNGDGTATIYGITSTAAGSGGATLNDEGADPNQLVSIRDNLAATTLPSESFTVLETAAYGDVLRGVAFVPQRLELTGAVSELTHGDAGAFDVPLPLTGSRGIECRSSSSLGAGNYEMIFSFTNDLISVGDVSVTGVGSVSTTSMGPNPNQFTVNLTGVANAQYLTVSLSNVLDAQNNTGNVSSTMGVLIGDVNGSGVVDSGDVFLVRQYTGQNSTNSNFRQDVNASGLIDSGDVFLTRQQTDTMLPTPSARVFGMRPRLGRLSR